MSPAECFPADQVVAADAERVLGPRVGVDLGLRQEALEAGEAVALVARDDLQAVLKLPVRQVGLVTPQVEVDTAGTGDSGGR